MPLLTSIDDVLMCLVSTSSTYPSTFPVGVPLSDCYKMYINATRDYEVAIWVRFCHIIQHRMWLYGTYGYDTRHLLPPTGPAGGQPLANV